MSVQSPSVRLQLTLNPDARALAFIVSILSPFGVYTQERILKAAAQSFGFRLEKAS